MNEPLQGSSDLDHLVLKLVSDLVSFDTTSRNSNLEIIEFVRSYLEDHGVESLLVFDESRTKAYRTAEDPNDISIILYDVEMEVLPKMMSDSGLNCPDQPTRFNLVWRVSRHLDLGVHRIFSDFLSDSSRNWSNES